MEQLKASGVEYVFCNPGSTETGFYDELADTSEMQIIMGLHEGIVISMADGYAKVTQKPAFVNIHAAVGTAQAGGQLYNSHLHGTPLVVTAGMSDTQINTDNAALAPRPGFTQADIPKQFTKISWEIRNGASTALAIRRAYKVATTAPGGPVYIAYASNGLREKVSGRVWPGEKFLMDARPRPAADKVETLAKWLIEAQAPTLVYGDEITKSGAAAEAVELAELLGVAVAAGNRAFNNFPTEHSQNTGRFTSRRSHPSGQADVVVQFGSRDPGGGSIPEEPLMGGQGRFVAVGMDANALGRTQPMDLAIVADAGETLRAVIDSVKSMATAARLNTIRADRLAVVEPAAAQRLENVRRGARQNFAQAPIHPDRLDYELAQAADPHAIIVEESFTGRQNFQKFGHRDDEKTLLTKAGSLGWGVGAGIGAKIGAPDREVILNIGDGAVMYSSSGFWTMARYDVPLLTVVWNNKNYQTVRNAYHRYQGRMVDTQQYHGVYLGDPDINFAKLAEAQGVKGEQVTSPADLSAALQRGLAVTRGGQPYVLDVAVSRVGGGAESTWYHKYSVADEAKA